MKAEDWQQVDKLFQAAVELAPGGRAAFLDVACRGNKALRDEVVSLLTADSREWDFIERPALESAAVLLEDEQPRLSEGQQVSHYEILKLIGKGGMGEVYLARDQVLGRNVALKLLPFDYTQDENRLRRFQREAQTVSALNHPNIITIHEFGSVGDQQFIATELIEGETLRKHIRRGPLPLSDALEIAIQTASALAAAHRAGIVHRDIKPENIMLRPDGYVKVLDFGLAKLAEESELHSLPTSAERVDVSSGLLMGTLRYMSPEQASGLPVDARSDIFSLGVVFYEMVTARPPFDDKNPAALAESILKDDPPPLSNDLEGIPEMLAGVVAKMLNKDKKARYQHADELIIDLKLLRELETLDSEHTGTPRIGHRPIAGMNEIATDKGTSVRATSFSGISGNGSRGIAFALIVFLSAVAAIGYASYKFLQSSSADPLAVKSLSEGTWTTKAPISSPRWHAEPAVLNGVLYVAGGWNVCTPFADLESYDPGTDYWTQRAPLLTARGGHGVGALDGKLYAVGGSVDCGVHISSVEAYDPANNSWSEKTPLPTPRIGHVVAVTQGKLYAIGGEVSAGGGYLSSNTEYDPHSNTWIERSPMPTPRTGAAATVVNGIIYVIGGSGNSGTLATVEAYDPVTDSWTSRRPMLIPRVSFAASEAGGLIYAFGGGGNGIQVETYDPAADSWTVEARMPTRGTHFHAATLGGTIYFAGGSNGGNYVSRVMAFTPAPHASPGAAMCPTLNVTPKAEMPTKRSNMAVGEINGIIYVAGGYENTLRYLAVNEAYDPAADRWTNKAPMPAARETRGTNNAVVDGKMYVIGGNARGNCSDLNEAYDPVTDSWMTRARMPTPRCHLAVVAHNGLIYAVGGTNTSGSIEYSTVEVYDPSVDAWTTAAPMPTGRQDLAAVSLNGLLYAVGGGNPAMSSGGELSTLEAYDPISNTWTIKTPMPTARAALAAGVLDGLLVVIGGGNETPLAKVEAYDPIIDRWTILTNIPTTRTFLSAVTVNNTLFALGGNSSPESNGSLTVNDALTLVQCPDN